MHQLLLLRHAKSALGDAGLADHARPLNGRGREDAAAMGAAMRGLGLVPDIVLVSSALRTRETMAALEPWDGTPLVEELEPLYLAPPFRMLALLREVTETARSVLLIGHNPGMHELAILLAGEQAMDDDGPAARALAEGFPTGTLAEFAIPGPWRDLADGGGRLLRLLRPRDLKPPP